MHPQNTQDQALRDDIQEAIEGAIPDDLPGYRQRYTDKAVDRVLAVITAREAARLHDAEALDKAARLIEHASRSTYQVVLMEHQEAANWLREVTP